MSSTLKNLREKGLDFAANGVFIAPNYVSSEQCAVLLSLIDKYRKSNGVPTIHRAAGSRPLHYSVIDGEKIRRDFPEVLGIYEDINQFVVELSGLDLVPLEDEKVACNINITGKGGSYRWHYDRNAVTAILYLNAVGGGETECYPNYRLALGSGRYSVLQRWLDWLLQTAMFRLIFGKLLVVKPVAGTLLVMRGDKCLHSVRPVTGDDDRVNIIASFDVPGAKYAVASQLNDYLYNRDTSALSDANYT